MTHKREAAVVDNVFYGTEDHGILTCTVGLRFGPTDLTGQHGESGKTRGEILDGYKEELERWKRALNLAERLVQKL